LGDRASEFSSLKSPSQNSRGDSKPVRCLAYGSWACFSFDLKQWQIFLGLVWRRGKRRRGTTREENRFLSLLWKSSLFCFVFITSVPLFAPLSAKKASS